MIAVSSVAPGEGGTTPLQPANKRTSRVKDIMAKNMRDFFIGNLLFIIYIYFLSFR